jgi:hypothetical protein
MRFSKRDAMEAKAMAIAIFAATVAFNYFGYPGSGLLT